MEKYGRSICTLKRWPKDELDIDNLKEKFEKAFWADVEGQKWGNGSKCCNYFGNMFGKSLKAVLTQMKYSTLNGQTFETIDEIMNDFGNLSHLLGFETKDQTQLKQPIRTRVK